MRKPNVIFLSIIALAAALPHTSNWMSADKPAAGPSVASEQPKPMAVQSQPQATMVTTPVAIEAPAAAVAAEEQLATATEEPHQWDVLPIEEPVAAAEPLAELEEAYMTEAFDLDWATPLEESFHTVFDAVRLQDSRVEQAECRTTLCRFAITHKNSAAQDAFVQAFLQSRLLPMNQVTIAQHSHKTADGSIAAVYFLARNELAQVHN